MKLRTVEMAKLDVNKLLEDMNEQEKMIYYFLNCHKGMDDSKIKVMIESDGGDSNVGEACRNHIG